MNMGERLKELRLQKGDTQEDVGKVLGVAKATIMKYEKGLVENLKRSSIEKLAKYFDVTPSYLMCLDNNTPKSYNLSTSVVEIPLLGNIKSNYNYLAEKNWIGTVSIDKNLADSGDFFALKIHDNSMSPILIENDIAIVKEQNYFDDGDIVVSIVNGNEATVKKGKKMHNSILLQPFNNSYDPLMFTPEEVKSVPVTILGIVKQLKREF